MDQGDPYHDGGMGFDEGAPARPTTNTLGLVGFVLSFCTGPIGLVVCLIALTKPPRGFAIAGVFISLISSVLLGLAIAAGVFGTGFVRAMSVGPDVTAWQRELEAVRSTSGSYPASADALALPADALEDPWGTPWRYEPVAGGANYKLTSAGRDKSFGTVDDMLIASQNSPGVALMAAMGSGVTFGMDEVDSYMAGTLAVERVTGAVDEFERETGSPPASLDEVRTLTPELIAGGFGAPVEYELAEDGASFAVIDPGPDGAVGTDDDIGMEEVRELQREAETIPVEGASP